MGIGSQAIARLLGVILMLSALTGCRSNPMIVHATEPLSLNPTEGILKGPYEIQNESGKPIGVKMWTEGEIKQIE